MTQLEIAQKISVFAKRLAEIMDSTERARNFEKEILVNDIKTLASMLRFTP